DQSLPVVWKQRLAAVSLKALLDTIREARGPMVKLGLRFGRGGEDGRLEILRIRRRWSCRLRFAVTEVRSGNRMLLLEWKDGVKLPDRVLRFWGPSEPLDCRLDDGVEELEIEELTTRMPDGRYLLEFDTRDDEKWFTPQEPDYFNERVQVIRLGESSVELLGSPAERLDALLDASECCGPADPALRDAVLPDILAEPTSARRALRDRGWVGLKTLFAPDGPDSNACGDVEAIYEEISWSDPRYAVAFLKVMKMATGRLDCDKGEILAVELDDGDVHPVVILYRADTQNDIRKNRQPRKRRFDSSVEEGRLRVVSKKWHCARPSEWFHEVEQFVLSWFQRALCRGVASCRGDVEGRIEELGRRAFLSDPNVYLDALVRADEELSRCNAEGPCAKPRV
ncbi:MAG: hypothetical protein ACYC61_22205, partial [Isosphaeraceae bacterium]